jgi:uncharacterized RDD family membrane protein YckC
MSANDERSDPPPSSLPTRRDPRAGRRPEDIAVGAVVNGARVGLRAGRLAVLPLRVAVRLVGPARVDRATGALGADGRTASTQGRDLAESAVDRALSGPLPDALAQKLVEHRVIERIVGDVMRQIDLDAMVTEVLSDERTRAHIDQALANPELEKLAVSAVESKLTGRVAEQLLASPEVQAAIARQTTSLGAQLLAKLRVRLQRVDEQLFRRSSPDEGVHYGGVATRAIALTVDAFLAHLAVLVPAAVIALLASLVGGFHSSWWVDTSLGVGWFVVLAVYFVFFWSVLGQTPGMILMGVEITDSHGTTPGVVRSFVRLLGVWLSILLLFAGFLPVLFDGRRRGLADFLAGTRVRIAR